MCEIILQNAKTIKKSFTSVLTGENIVTDTFSSDWKSESFNVNFLHSRYERSNLIKYLFKN